MDRDCELPRALKTAREYHGGVFDLNVSCTSLSAGVVCPPPPDPEDLIHSRYPKLSSQRRVPWCRYSDAV